jgi:hypothetical protein
MYGYVIIISSIVIFTFSNYMHLSHMHAFDHMIAFVGKEHVRTFEHQFDHAHADLWAFGHRKRKSNRLHFGRDVFETFRDYGYKHMLLLNELHHIPLMYSESVIEYKIENRTVASLWPRPTEQEEWPGGGFDSALDWFKDIGGTSDIIHL